MLPYVTAIARYLTRSDISSLKSASQGVWFGLQYCGGGLFFCFFACVLFCHSRCAAAACAFVFPCACSSAVAPRGRVSSRSVLPDIGAESTAVDYAEQLLAPGMPPLDEIKDLKVRAACCAKQEVGGGG